MGGVKKFFKALNPIALVSKVAKSVSGSQKQDNSAAIAQQEALDKRKADQEKAEAATVQKQKEEDEKKARLLAIRQGGLGGQLTPSGGVQGQATTARKQLLGL